MNDVIGPFDREFDFLSNFFPCRVEFEGLTFQSSEAAFQAAKSNSMEERSRFTTVNASKSKRMGRKVALRNDWESVKIDVMRQVLQCKFNQNAELREKLVKTGDAQLTEFNTWKDSWWGVYNGKGHNHLGKLLMEVRSHLKDE